MKRRKRSRLVILLFAVSVLIFFSSNLFLRQTVLFRQEVPASLTVSNRTGFDVSPVFAFSEVMPDGSATRTAHIINNYNFPIIVSFNPEGKIKKFVSRVTVILKSREEKDIEVSAKVPHNAEKGNYDGFIVFEARRAILSWEEK